MTDRQAILAFALARHGIEPSAIGGLILARKEWVKAALESPLRGYAIPPDWTPAVLQQQIEYYLRLANVRDRA